MLKPTGRKDNAMSLRLSAKDEQNIKLIQEYCTKKVPLMSKATKSEVVLIAIRTFAQHIYNEQHRKNGLDH